MSKQFHTPKIVQGPQSWKIALSVLVLLACSATAAWYAYRFGLGEIGADSLFAVQQREIRQQLAKEMEAQVKELRIQVAGLERSAQIDAESATEVRLQLLGLEQENEQLKEDLAFYRSIVSPEDEDAGMQIQNFRLKALDDERRFQYEIVLTQPLQYQRFVRGDVGFAVQGSENGEPKTLELKNIAVGDDKSHEFRFKFFQNFTGTIELPVGFEPAIVVVTAEPAGKSSANLTREFPWPGRG